MVWYFPFLKNFPQFIVIDTVKGFGIVNKAEIDVFLELSCFFKDPADVGKTSLWQTSLWLCIFLTMGKFGFSCSLSPWTAGGYLLAGSSPGLLSGS